MDVYLRKRISLIVSHNNNSLIYLVLLPRLENSKETLLKVLRLKKKKKIFLNVGTSVVSMEVFDYICLNVWVDMVLSKANYLF